MKEEPGDVQSDGAERHLKAIMFTDIMDYTAMMSTNERRTMELLLEQREIVRSVLPEHRGFEHETIGDAFVVLFDSVVNALHCAVEIQRRLTTRNNTHPADKQVWIRIGIHLGDIIMKDGGIYGAGVNIAARVEPLAAPGGICITEQVRLQVEDKVDYSLESLGRPPLKGIGNPPPIYRVHLPWDPSEQPWPSTLPAAKRSETEGKGRLALLVTAIVVPVVVILGGLAYLVGWVDLTGPTESEAPGSLRSREFDGLSRAPTEAVASVRTGDIVAPVDAGKSSADDTQGRQPTLSDAVGTVETSDAAAPAQEPQPGQEQTDVRDVRDTLADLPASLPADAGGPETAEEETKAERERAPEEAIENKDKAESKAGKHASKEPRDDVRQKKKGKGLGFRKVSLPGADKTETPETGEPADQKKKDKAERKGLGFRPVEIPDE